MKRSIMFATLFCATGLQAKSEEKGPLVIDAPVERLFVPYGFDDNDNAQVVVHGKFPSSCFNVGKTEAKVDHENKLIKVKADVLYYPNVYCLQSVTPFIQEVSVGVLKEGNYKVVLDTNEEINRSITIQSRKTESPDDYLYAPVENAYIDVDYQTGKQSLKLQGHFPYMYDGCMVMKEVRAYQHPENVLVVMPIAEIVTGAACDLQPADRSYTITKGLSQPFYGEGLLHVRTLHGAALNRYLDISENY